MINFKRIITTAQLFGKIQLNAFKFSPVASSLTHINVYNFALMQLFENNKRPEQLDPVFKRKTKLKGHVKFKKNSQVQSPKLNPKIKEQKVKLKNHKGLLKRIKIVGPRWDRQFKFRSPARYHLRRNKSRNNLTRKLRPRHIHQADLWRVKRLLPYFKRRTLKMRY